MKTLLLIDGHAMIHRAFHALPISLTTKSGEPTGAIYGFFLMLHKVLIDFKPTHVAVAFDTPKKTFRKKLYSGYQSKRPPMDESLKMQIPQIKALLDAGGLARLEMPGFEADDVIGTLVEKNKSLADRVLILTGDRDLLQLVEDHIFLIAPKHGVTNFDLFTPDKVKEKFGVAPDHIPDYKALAGDSSDNYNTAKGIGPKTAISLLTEFDNIENLIKNISKVQNPRWKAILSENIDNIILFKKIATIIRDVELKISFDDLKFDHFNDKLKSKLSNLELFSLITKLFNQVQKKSPAVVEKNKKENNEQINLF